MCDQKHNNNFLTGILLGAAVAVGAAYLMTTDEGKKMAKKIKKEEYVQDYYLQTACYGYTHNRMFGTNIRCAVIMMATRPDPTTGKEAEYAEYVIEGERFDYYVNEWFNRVEQYYKKIGK